MRRSRKRIIGKLKIFELIKKTSSLCKLNKSVKTDNRKKHSLYGSIKSAIIKGDFVCQGNICIYSNMKKKCYN